MIIGQISMYGSCVQHKRTHVVSALLSQPVAELDAVVAGEMHAVLVECKTRISAQSVVSLVEAKKKLE